MRCQDNQFLKKKHDLEIMPFCASMCFNERVVPIRDGDGYIICSSSFSVTAFNLHTQEPSVPHLPRLTVVRLRFTD